MSSEPKNYGAAFLGFAFFVVIAALFVLMALK